MSKAAPLPAIRLRGVRHNNLKNFDLDLTLGRLIVVTGPSGSGKSSLAFDTLFAEGQRRYIETFSPYARQFFDRMDKPQVDSIEGIPPAIAIEQRNAVKTTRSTVGTMTEICDHIKLLWPHIAQLHCRQCGQVVRKDTPQQIWSGLQAASDSGTEVLVTFGLPLTEKLSLEESLALVERQGYQRLLLSAEALRLEEAAARLREAKAHSLTVIQDRLKLAPAQRARFVEACEQAFHFGKGRLTIHWLGGASGAIQRAEAFSNRFHCARCDIEYREPSPALFSFNHPLGACPACRGFGRIISIDYRLVIPDESRTLAQGVVKPWLIGHGLESQRDLMTFCKKRKVPVNVPFRELDPKVRDWVIDGDPDYGKDDAHRWPRLWYGVKGYFRWLESKAYKMHVRVLLSRYRAYTPCPTCHGKRFQPEAQLFKVDGAMTLADFYALPVRDAVEVVAKLSARFRPKASEPLGLVLREVQSRLNYLAEVGLGYLTLDRPTRSLSGGETERVNLTTCLGTGLVNTLFVLDEPSVGLHPRDTDRLVRVLQRLRDAGNTVVVVEHEASVMRAADEIVDLGPGHGETGGQVVFQGPFRDVLKAEQSLTGKYLSGKRKVEIPERRAVLPLLGERAGVRGTDASHARMIRTQTPATLTLSHASLHNLKDLTVEIPLQRFVCVTGVSGSGKTTLVREVLLPALAAHLQAEGVTRNKDEDDSQDDETEPGHAGGTSVEGWEALGRVVLVDQSILGKTPRSNPAVYIGAFDDIRDVFAQSPLAKQRGVNASAFSFNSAQGQCERCRGAGFEKIEMQFLSDVFIRCPECDGRRYRPHILEIKMEAASPAVSLSPQRGEGSRVRGGSHQQRPSRQDAETDLPLPKGEGRGEGKGSAKSPATSKSSPAWSIADMLEATVDEAIAFLESFADCKPAKRAAQSLALLQQVGLGYLRLGQPINTLSGGESQRLKLVRHLAEFTAAEARAARPTLFLFDEPTTGLHFDDVRVLLQVFQRLVEAGHSVLVIEHNLDVIKCADWLIDLGPDAGDQGGEMVVAGTPEQVAACPASHTGQALRPML
ncbi:MAG: excinuclease ABC subunit UvrA [Verrucomicrobiota bacterium]